MRWRADERVTPLTQRLFNVKGGFIITGRGVEVERSNEEKRDGGNETREGLEGLQGLEKKDAPFRGGREGLLTEWVYAAASAAQLFSENGLINNRTKRGMGMERTNTPNVGESSG